MRKKVIFACGTGVATSTVVAQRVVQYCQEHGFDLDYEQTNLGALQPLDGTADLIVCTTNVPFELKTPVINGMSLITGIGEDEVLDQILNTLRVK